MSKQLQNKDLKRRILEISYNLKLSHVGSCITAVDIIKEIYDIKKPYEKFILSSGHAHLAHLVVAMDKQGSHNPATTKIIEASIREWGIHCDREALCDVSTGSLGHGLGIALGMALADRSKDVYCLISDGESNEGSIFEALRIKKEFKVENLKIYMNYNGWAAYKDMDREFIMTYYAPLGGIKVIETNFDDFPFLKGQEAHYHALTEEEYKQGLEILK